MKVEYEIFATNRYEIYVGGEKMEPWQVAKLLENYFAARPAGAWDERYYWWRCECQASGNTRQPDTAVCSKCLTIRPLGKVGKVFGKVRPDTWTCRCASDSLRDITIATCPVCTWTRPPVKEIQCLEFVEE